MNELTRPLDSHRTSDELAAAAPQIALLPIGSTEQHSHHLPCCTDTMIADAICDGIARRLPVWRLPTLPISVSHMHRGSAGSVWVGNETFLHLVKEIVLSVRHQGVHKVVIANFHGGNFILRPVVQDLNRDYGDLTVILLEPEVDLS
ncbi:MAG: creatininase family protein, partial [Phycisphaerae bacterium]